jgi:hypothetical protein
LIIVLALPVGAFSNRGTVGKPKGVNFFRLLAKWLGASANRGASLVFTNFAVEVAGQMGSSIIREFLSKRLTTNVPGNGKPSTPGNGKP